MKELKGLFSGLLIVLFTSVLVLGSLSISLAEAPYTSVAIRPTRTPPFSPAVHPTNTLPPTTSTNNPISPTPTTTSTNLPSPTSCPLPSGWESYSVQSGDTLDSLAQLHGLSNSDLLEANCLVSASLIPGTTLYLPPLPTIQASFTPTITSIPCGPPLGWVPYTIKANDSLSLLSVLFGVRIYELQNANCMGNSTLIHTGDTLYVPRYPVILYTTTLTPTPTWTLSPTGTSIPSSTFTQPVPDTATNTQLPSETPSETPVITEAITEAITEPPQTP